MLFTFKYIEIPHYQEMLSEIKDNLDLEYLRQVNLTFIQFNPENLIPKCTMLRKWLTEHNLNAIKTVIVKGVPYWHKSNIHIDNCNAKTFDELKLNYVHDYKSQTRDLLGLQFGIDNIENTHTSMFRYVSGEIIKNDFLRSTNKTKERGYPSMRFETCEMEEIARYVATQPVIFNATVPHSVVNTTDRPRLLLSLRFDPDPWHLVK